MTTVTISLPESLKDFLSQQVRTRGYGNVSEYFRGLLREAQAKEERARIESLLLEGLAHGDDIPVTRKFWRELSAEALRAGSKKRMVRLKRR